jgi:hypothetical protein
VYIPRRVTTLDSFWQDDAFGLLAEAMLSALNEPNTAALALFDGFGARRVGSNLELVLR